MKGNLAKRTQKQDTSRLWGLLHSSAAYYAPTPTDHQKQQALHFCETVSLLAPSTQWRLKFEQFMQESPPRVESRDALRKWMCEQHNRFNKEKGKEEFVCSTEALQKRWGG